MYGGEPLNGDKPSLDPYADPPPTNGTTDVEIPMNGSSDNHVPRRERSRSRSRSRSPVRNRSPRRSSPPPYRRRSPPPPKRPNHAPIAPNPSQVLGVFGLSIRTLERDLEDEFNRHGQVEKVNIVYDQRSGRSRGFGFIKMATTDEAAMCIEKLNGIELNGRRIRVDYSVTDRPHQPTPGEYMGHRKSSYRDDRYGDRDRGSRHDRDRERGYGRDRYEDRDYRDRDRDRDSYGRDWRDRDRDRDWKERRSPRGRHSPSPPPRRKRSYSRSPPRGAGSSPTAAKKEEVVEDRGGSRW